MPLDESKPGTAFPGVIDRTFDRSEPARPEPRRARPGASDHPQVRRPATPEQGDHLTEDLAMHAPPQIEDTEAQLRAVMAHP